MAGSRSRHTLPTEGNYVVRCSWLPEKAMHLSIAAMLLMPPRISFPSTKRLDSLGCGISVDELGEIRLLAFERT